METISLAYPITVVDVAIRLRRGYCECVAYLKRLGLDLETYPDALDTPTRVFSIGKSYNRPRKINYVVAHDVPLDLVPSLRRYGVVFPRRHI